MSNVGGYIDIPSAGGAGTGTVTNTGGALTSNAVVLGAGGNDTKVSTGITSNGASEVDLGLNGTASGILGLNGSTSGKATITAPAIAGTTSNAVVFTNDIATPGISFVNPVAEPASASGIFLTGATIMNFPIAGSNILSISNKAVTANQIFTPAANKVVVASNFTTAANTNLQTITGLAWSNANGVASSFNFHCVLVYSQASGAAAVAFGIQVATTNPTNVFATGVQQITAGPPATFVTGTLATLATTTATAIVSGTPGAQGVNYTAILDGTLELTAAANTVNIMVSTATSGDAVTVLRGSYFMVF